MSNPFLAYGTKDVATAKLYEKAVIADLEKIFGTNAPALTDGKKIYVNTEDNLFKTFPNYCIGMLKWLLWHEEQHLNLKHYDRFFRYISELKESDLLDKFKVTKDEVNIIMDILVHDSLCKWFPDLVEIAKSNYAQLRNCNSLGYTFKTFTLEEMLDEYRKFKESAEDEKDEGGSEQEEDEDGEDKDGASDGDEPADDKSAKESKSKDESKKKRKPAKKKPKDTPEEDDQDKDEQKEPEDKTPPKKPEHQDVDWDKAADIDSKEFITEDEAYIIDTAIQKIKRKKLKLARVTETLNGLATSQKIRSYAVPSRIQVSKGVILKGRKPGKAKLYLIFDASGSMHYDMQMFKDIITGAIPQAMEAPCEWFAGWSSKAIKSLMNNEAMSDVRKTGRLIHSSSKYYKGKFKDFISVEAYDGYSDDGYRVLELCAKAEEKGYNPIGITDGGASGVRPSEIALVKKLKRTIIVGDNETWMASVKRHNPAIQTINTKDETYDEDEE